MKLKSEKGYALPLVMLAVMVGAVVIPPFLEHAGGSLIGSRVYADAIYEQYAVDAGVEQAVWSLTKATQDDVDAGTEQEIVKLTQADDVKKLVNPGDTVSYELQEKVNDLVTSVKVSYCWETIAQDDFNSGTWDGGEGWLDDWSTHGKASIVDTGTPYEGKCHLMLQDGGGYAMRPVDLSRQVSARLRFRAKVNGFESNDNSACKVSADGINWTDVYTWTSEDSDNVYHYYDINLTTYGLTEKYWIAFYANMNNSSDYFYVDALDIVWEVGIYSTVASDDFESGGWKGGAGWLEDWKYAGSASIAGDASRIAGSYQMLLQSSDGYAARSVNLADQGIVHLQFWAMVDSFEGSEYAYALASSNGKAWSVIYTWDRNDDDNQYHYYDIDLSAYTLTDTFWIAFQAGMKHTTDYFYVDDIEVQSMHGYVITVTAGDTIMKAVADIVDGKVTVLGWYYV